MERMNLKDKTKLIQALGKIFPESLDNLRVEEMLDQGFMDPANVCMFVPLSDDARDCFKGFTDRENKKQNVLELHYNIKDIEEIRLNIAKYSMEYIKKIIACFTMFETIKISLKNDYPATFECEHFKIILAPRISND